MTLHATIADRPLIGHASRSAPPVSRNCGAAPAAMTGDGGGFVPVGALVARIVAAAEATLARHIESPGHRVPGHRGIERGIIE